MWGVNIYNQKGTWFLAGWNTMIKEEKATYNEKRLFLTVSMHFKTPFLIEWCFIISIYLCITIPLTLLSSSTFNRVSLFAVNAIP